MRSCAAHLVLAEWLSGYVEIVDASVKAASDHVQDYATPLGRECQSKGDRLNN